VYSTDEVESAINSVAHQINQAFKDTPVVLMCVMTGGLYFSGKLLSKLMMPVELDYVQANRYHAELTGGSLVWAKLPSLDLNDKTVLLIDDILDEGITLQAVHAKCLELGAKTVKMVVMADKLNQQDKPVHADFTAFNVPNLFVFGCGMDAHGWWRNLPEIRAIS
jgi:hypoxanthine phosphoribosyltransferase